jgi:hypothetical protein
MKHRLGLYIKEAYATGDEAKQEPAGHAFIKVTFYLARSGGW